MYTKKYGFVEWNEPLNSKKTKDQKRSEFLTLGEGSNLIRIVTKAHQYYSHKYKHKDDPSPGFGDKIMCSMRKKDDPCPVCEEGSKPSRRWYVGAIDRKTQTFKIVDITYTTMQSLQTYAENKKFGDPIGYDLDIKVNRDSGGAGYYTVCVDPPSPLSEEDRKIIATIDPDNLPRLCMPPTYEKALARMNFCLDRKGLAKKEASAAGLAQANQTEGQAPTVVAPKHSINMGEEEFDFPPAQQD